MTQDACIFYDDHTVITAQGGAVVFEIEAGKELASHFPTGKAAIHQNHGLFTVGETVDEAAFWFISMERSCQAQLVAMAAGEPKHINHEYASYTRRSHWLPLRRLVQLPAAVGRDLAQRTRTVRLTGRDASAPAVRLAPGRSAYLDTVTPEALFVLSALAQYTGASIAVLLFDEVEPQTVAWFRVIGAGAGRARRVAQRLARLDAARPGGGRHLRHRHGADEPVLLPRRSTALDLGKSVAIEFIGPIAVAAATRARRATPSPSPSPSLGVLVLGGVEVDDNAVGLLFILAASAMWAAYIVVGARVAQLDRGVTGLGIGLAIGAVVIAPIGAPWSGPVWASAPAARRCASSSACSRTRSATASTST